MNSALVGWQLDLTISTVLVFFSLAPPVWNGRFPSLANLRVPTPAIRDIRDVAQDLPYGSVELELAVPRHTLSRSTRGGNPGPNDVEP